MSEFPATEQMMKAVSAVNAAKPGRIEKMDDDTAKSWARDIAENNDVKAKHVDEMSGAVQEPTVDEVLNRLTKVSGEVLDRTEQVSFKAAESWSYLGEKAKEVGGAESQVEALLIAENVVTKNAEVQAAKQVLAESLIDSLRREGYKGPTAKLIDLTVQSYILDLPPEQREGLDAQTINAGTLKLDPRFQNYRDAIVRKVQKLGEDTKSVDMRTDVRGSIKNVWNKSTMALRFGLDHEGRKQLFAHMDAGSALASKEAVLNRMPSVEVANSYLADFGVFERRAGVAMDNKAVADAMPIIEAELGEEQAAIIDNSIVDAVDGVNGSKTAQEMNDEHSNARYRESWRKALIQDKMMEQVEEEDLLWDQEFGFGLEMAKANDLEYALGQDKLRAAEAQARMELSDLRVQANGLADLAGEHRQLGMDALQALGELNFAVESMKNFNAQIAKGKLPSELEDLIHGDVGADVDSFISSNGKKGNVDSVKTLFKKLGILVTKAQREEGLPTSFLSLNTLDDGEQSMETGISAGLSQDGSWELRLATRKDDKVDINPTAPVIRLEPENIMVSFNTIQDQENNLEEARATVAQYESSMKLPGGSKAVREQTQRKLVAAEKSVEAYKKSLATAKAELAAQLKTTAVDKSLSGAFDELTKAQSEVAERFYQQGFVEMVDKLSSEFNIPASQVTAEALAALAASAEHTQTVASDMADFFNKAENGYVSLMADAFNKNRDQIEAIADQWALIREGKVAIERLPEDAKVAAMAKLNKAEKGVLKTLAVIGEEINNDFVESVPEALREGSKVIPMTKTEFKHSVNAKLRANGFAMKVGDEEMDKKLKALFGKGVSSIAEGVRQGFSYDADIKAMADASTDALRVIGDSSQARILKEAIDGGDVDTFVHWAQTVASVKAEENIVAHTREADAAKLAELLSTPEGIAQALETGELTIEGAVDAIMTGKADAADVMSALEGKLEVTRNEAAHRLGAEIAAIDVKFDPATETDPLAGRSDIVAMVQFIQRQTMGQNSPGYWRGLLQRASAEKKTTVNQE